MKITDVRTTVFRYRSNVVTDWEGHSHPAHYIGKGWVWMTQSLTEIVTDEGVNGLCLGGKPRLNEALKRILVGGNPLDREKVWQRLHYMKHVVKEQRDVCVIDNALWDFAGKLTNLPVSKLLGGFREKILAYGSTMCGEIEKPCGLSSPEEFADFAEALKKRGYKALKLHTFEPGMLWKDVYHYGKADRYVKMDVEACKAVRERVGSEMVLMLDACHNYNLEQALWVGRELERLNFFWYEEPMLEHHTHAYVKLCQQLTIPVCSPETLTRLGPKARAEWIIRGASDMSRVSCLDVGGITAAKKTADLCDCFGVRCTMHGSSHGDLQVLGAIWNCDYAERGLLHPTIDFERRCEEPGTTPYLKESPDPMDRDGFVHIPQKQGLGLELDWDFIEENTVKTK
ncbi:MAG: enolase C-terminal domain-like protein [Candidatus Bathyarchaeia archaeon]